MDASRGAPYRHAVNRRFFDRMAGCRNIQLPRGIRFVEVSDLEHEDAPQPGMVAYNQDVGAPVAQPKEVADPSWCSRFPSVSRCVHDFESLILFPRAQFFATRFQFRDRVVDLMLIYDCISVTLPLPQRVDIIVPTGVVFVIRHIFYFFCSMVAHPTIVPYPC